MEEISIRSSPKFYNGKNMDINQINECMILSLVGKANLAQIVVKLLAAGVERYVVDLVTFRRITYGNEGEHYAVPFSFPDTPKIPKSLDIVALKNTISQIRQYKIDYQTYLREIMMAGCCQHQVYIHNKKIIYIGRDGNHYVEDFSLLK